jgi:hypothetical protein
MQRIDPQLTEPKRGILCEVMEFKCPACQSIIYSRKQKVCGQCGAALPPEMLLTDAQIRFFEGEQKKADKRARESGIQIDPGGPTFDIGL